MICLSYNVELGDRIKKIRLSLGKTQEEFGRMFDPPAPKSAVSRWEHGGSPNKKRLKAIADFGNVSISYLLGTDKVVKSALDTVNDISSSQYSRLTKILFETISNEKKKNLEELQSKISDPQEFDNFVFTVTELLTIFLYAKSNSNAKMAEKYKSIQNSIDELGSELPEFQLPSIF